MSVLPEPMGNAPAVVAVRKEVARLLEHRSLPPILILGETGTGWFTEGFDTPDLKDARARLDALA